MCGWHELLPRTITPSTRPLGQPSARAIAAWRMHAGGLAGGVGDLLQLARRPLAGNIAGRSNTIFRTRAEAVLTLHMITRRTPARPPTGAGDER